MRRIGYRRGDRSSRLRWRGCHQLFDRRRCDRSVRSAQRHAERCVCIFPGAKRRHRDRGGGGQRRARSAFHIRTRQRAVGDRRSEREPQPCVRQCACRSLQWCRAGVRAERSRFHVRLWSGEDRLRGRLRFRAVRRGRHRRRFADRKKQSVCARHVSWRNRRLRSRHLRTRRKRLQRESRRRGRIHSRQHRGRRRNGDQRRSLPARRTHRLQRRPNAQDVARARQHTHGAHYRRERVARRCERRHSRIGQLARTGRIPRRRVETGYCRAGFKHSFIGRIQHRSGAAVGHIDGIAARRRIGRVAHRGASGLGSVTHRIGVARHRFTVDTLARRIDAGDTARCGRRTRAARRCREGRPLSSHERGRHPRRGG